MSDVKQVIVIRKDLKMRRGKEIAQGAHASIAWLTNRLELIEYKGRDEVIYDCILEDFENDWIEGSFTKVTCKVDSEEELMAIYEAAKKARLNVQLITDAGKTEFNGVPTRTCLAVGPNRTEDVDKITGHLTLY